MDLNFSSMLTFTFTLGTNELLNTLTLLDRQTYLRMKVECPMIGEVPKRQGTRYAN